MILRWYQDQAVEAVWDYLCKNREGAPCVALPTGSGKTPVIAKLCERVVSFGGRVCVLAHVKELLLQNAEKLRMFVAPELVGIYSAGLNERATDSPIVVAGIQSVYQRAKELGAFQLIVVDEAHLIPPDGEGRYRTFLTAAKEVNPEVRLVGLTATPYRLGCGWITNDRAQSLGSQYAGGDPLETEAANAANSRPSLVGDGSWYAKSGQATNGSGCDRPSARLARTGSRASRLLDTIVYDVELSDLIAGGFLSPVVSRASARAPDFSGVHTVRGDFNEEEVEKILSGKNVLASICSEIVAQTANRRKVVVFCNRVESARRCAAILGSLDPEYDAALVDGSTPDVERDELVRRFKDDAAVVDLFGEKKKPLKYVCNVGVLTTGFDAPNVDCVAIVRPTKSLALYQQIVGRGLRICDGKDDCLVLDYGGNIERHGPINLARPRQGGRKVDGFVPPFKICPECRVALPIAATVCPECGKAFEKSKPNDPNKGLTNEASDRAVVADEGEPIVEELDVSGVEYSEHYKKNAEPGTPSTLQVKYLRGQFGKPVFEWLCPEHENDWVRGRFEKWWRERSAIAPPATTADAARWAAAGALSVPRKIRTTRKPKERFARIEWVEAGPIPEFDPTKLVDEDAAFFDEFNQFEEDRGPVEIHMCRDCRSYYPCEETCLGYCVRTKRDNLAPETHACEKYDERFVDLSDVPF